MKSSFKIISCILLVMLSFKGNAQTKFGDNKTTINGSSLLELESTNKGVLMPRISLTNTTTWGLATATPVNGMVVYNTNFAMAGTAGAPTLTDIIGMYYWDGAKWVGMSGQQKTDTDLLYWALKGNAATTPPTVVGTSVGGNNYWGTKDAKNLAIGTNSTTRAIFDQNGSLYGGSGTFDATLNPLQSLVWGNTNKDSANYALITGQGNKLSPNSNYSSLSGTGNTISTTGSSEGNTMFGIGSTIDGTYSAANIVGGYYNSIHATESSSNANAIFGYLNTLSGPRAGQNIVGGTAHQIQSTGNLVSGNNNKIGLNANYNVIGGRSNVMPDDPNLNAFGGHNAIFGGENKDSAGYTLLAGKENSISTNAWYSTVSGYYNHIYGGVGVSIFGQVNNAYNTPGFLNNTGGGFIAGSLNNMTNNNSSAILGEFNTVYGNASGISGALVGGSNNKDSASYSFVAGQYNVVKPGATNSVALGSYNTAGHSNSFALGNGATTTKANQLVAKFSGGVVLSPLPSYANDAAADADATLPSGSLYKLTGSRAVYQKP